MANDSPNIQEYGHGRGYYSGNYPIYKREPDETAVAEFGKQIAGIINNFKAGYYEPLNRIMHGVKEGLIDPNDALVQGTRGGKLFESYYGVKPPEARRPEMAQTTSYTSPSEDIASGGEAPFNPNVPGVQFSAPTGRMTGGFTPTTLAQLQQHVIRESSAGRQVPSNLLALSGLAKSISQQELLDPSIQERLAKIKGTPAMNRAMNQLRIQFPNAQIEDIMAYAEAQGGSTSPEVLARANNLGQSKDQQAIASKEKINSLREQARNGRLDTRIKAQKELHEMTIALGDRKLQAQTERDEGRNHQAIMLRLAPHVGTENAATIANEFVYGEGDYNNLPESLRDEAKAAFKLDQDYKRAKMSSAQKSADTKDEALDLRRVRLNQEADKLQANIAHWANIAENKSSVDEDKTELAVLRIMMNDPAMRATASLNGKKFLEGRGVPVAEPEGIFTLLGRYARGLGVPDAFTPAAPSTQTPMVPPQKTQDGRGFVNMPRVTRPTPKAPSAPTFSTPKAAEVWQKYGGAPTESQR